MKEHKPDYRSIVLPDGRRAFTDSARDNEIVESFSANISDRFVWQRLTELWRETL